MSEQEQMVLSDSEQFYHDIVVVKEAMTAEGRIHAERIEDYVDALAAQLKEREDWSSDDVVHAVERIRDAARMDDDSVAVSPVDLRMLLASVDGVADSYSILLEHTTGLTKPTTDPRIAIAIADDKESERFRDYLKDELAARAALEAATPPQVCPLA